MFSRGRVDPQNMAHPPVGQYSACKRKETLTQAATWMDLEDTLLREIAQSQRTDAVWLHSQEAPGGVTAIDTGSGWRGQGLAEREGSGRSVGTEGLFGK